VTGALTGHQRIDQRSLAMHTAIAEKLRANPALLEIAHDNLDRWSISVPRSKPYWDAWREILSRPLDEILALIVEDSERMTAMRQTSPFAGVLDPRERWAIYDRFRFRRARSRRLVTRLHSYDRKRSVCRVSRSPRHCAAVGRREPDRKAAITKYPRGTSGKRRRLCYNKSSFPQKQKWRCAFWRNRR
jgi:hypothetical protein